MSSFRTEIRKIAKKITLLHRKEINYIPLYDTGQLYRSFSTKIDVSSDGSVSIKIKAVDYFKYLDYPYAVSEDIYKSKEYKKLEDKLFRLVSLRFQIESKAKYKDTESVQYILTVPNAKNI